MEEMRAAESTIGSAFTGDLKALQQSAKDMVTLAERYTTQLSKKAGQASEDETSQLQSCLLQLGSA